MKVNAISQVTPFKGVAKVETKKAEVAKQTSPIEKAPMPIQLLAPPLTWPIPGIKTKINNTSEVKYIQIVYL